MVTQVLVLASVVALASEVDVSDRLGMFQQAI